MHHRSASINAFPPLSPCLILSSSVELGIQLMFPLKQSPEGPSRLYLERFPKSTSVCTGSVVHVLHEQSDRRETVNLNMSYSTCAITGIVGITKQHSIDGRVHYHFHAGCVACAFDNQRQRVLRIIVRCIDGGIDTAFFFMTGDSALVVVAVDCIHIASPDNISLGTDTTVRRD